MTDVTESKRLNDEELEAVAGGMTPIDPLLLNAMGHGFPGLNLNPTVADTHAAAAPPTIDPSAVAGLMHSTVSSAVAGGGAYTMETTTPAHTDTGTPTITGQTHITVSGASLFSGNSVIAPDSSASPSTSAPVVSGSVTLSGNLHVELPPGSITAENPAITVMHIDPTPVWTRVIPTVSAEQEPSANGPHSVLSNSF